eukprot:266799-Prymnesium_polylepis.2
MKFAVFYHKPSHDFSPLHVPRPAVRAAIPRAARWRLLFDELIARRDERLQLVQARRGRHRLCNAVSTGDAADVATCAQRVALLRQEAQGLVQQQAAQQHRASDQHLDRWARRAPRDAHHERTRHILEQLHHRHLGRRDPAGGARDCCVESAHECRVESRRKTECARQPCAGQQCSAMQRSRQEDERGCEQEAARRQEARIKVLVPHRRLSQRDQVGGEGCAGGQRDQVTGGRPRRPRPLPRTLAADEADAQKAGNDGAERAPRQRFAEHDNAEEGRPHRVERDEHVGSRWRRQQYRQGEAADGHGLQAPDDEQETGRQGARRSEEAAAGRVHGDGESERADSRALPEEHRSW